MQTIANFARCFAKNFHFVSFVQILKFSPVEKKTHKRATNCGTVDDKKTANRTYIYTYALNVAIFAIKLAQGSLG